MGENANEPLMFLFLHKNQTIGAESEFKPSDVSRSRTGFRRVPLASGAFILHVMMYFTDCVNLLRRIRVGLRGFGFTTDRKWPLEGDPTASWEMEVVWMYHPMWSDRLCAFSASFFLCFWVFWLFFSFIF